MNNYSYWAKNYTQAYCC